MNTLTFGRYAPYPTLTNKLDPRNKIIMTILMIIGIFFRFDKWSTSLIFSGAFLLVLIVLMIVSKVNFVELFNSLKGMWFLILFLFIVYILVPTSSKDGGVCFYIGSYAIYWGSIYMSIYIFLRLVMMLGLMMVLTTSTKPMDLTNAFEWFMYPLKIVHFPVHEIAMTLSIALRFIPTLLEETDRIMKAQASRGVDFNKGGLIKKFRAITSLIVPLFVSAIERSEELANAMEARGYDPKSKRTKYKTLHFKFRDYISFIFVVAAFVGLCILVNYDKTNPIDIINLLFHVEGF